MANEFLNALNAGMTRMQKLAPDFMSWDGSIYEGVKSDSDTRISLEDTSSDFSYSGKFVVKKSLFANSEYPVVNDPIEIDGIERRITSVQHVDDRNIPTITINYDAV